MYKSSKKKMNGGTFEKVIININKEKRRRYGKDEQVCNIYTSYTLANIDELAELAEQYIKIKDHLQKLELDPSVRENPSVSRLMKAISTTTDSIKLITREGNPTFINSIMENDIIDSINIVDVKDYINKLKESIDLQLKDQQCNNSSVIEVNIIYEKYSLKSIELNSKIKNYIKNTQKFLNDIAAYITKELTNKIVYITFWYNESVNPSQIKKENSFNRIIRDQLNLLKATEIGQEYKYPENLDEETIQKIIQTAAEKVEKRHPSKTNRWPLNLLSKSSKVHDTPNEGGNGKEYATYKGRKYIVRIGSKGGKYILVGIDKKKVYI